MVDTALRTRQCEKRILDRRECNPRSFPLGVGTEMVKGKRTGKAFCERRQTRDSRFALASTPLKNAKKITPVLQAKFFLGFYGKKRKKKSEANIQLAWPIKDLLYEKKITPENFAFGRTKRVIPLVAKSEQRIRFILPPSNN